MTDLTENTRVRLSGVPAHPGGNLQHLISDKRGWVQWDGDSHLTDVDLDKLEREPAIERTPVPIEPTYQSATQRRALRGAIRSTLGVSSDAPPTAAQAINAMHRIAKLVNLASGGRFSVALIDQRTGQFIDHNDALKIARGEK